MVRSSPPPTAERDLAVHTTSMWEKPGWLDFFWQYLCKGYLLLIWKDSITHMRDLAVYVKLELHSVIENTSDSYLCFQQVLIHSLPYFFFLYWSPSLYLCRIFETTSSKINEVFSSINRCAHVFLFGDLMPIVRVGWPIMLELTAEADLEAINHYHKVLHLGCCSSPGSTSGQIGKFLNDLIQMISFPT